MKEEKYTTELIILLKNAGLTEEAIDKKINKLPDNIDDNIVVKDAETLEEWPSREDINKYLGKVGLSLRPWEETPIAKGIDNAKNNFTYLRNLFKTDEPEQATADAQLIALPNPDNPNKKTVLSPSEIEARFSSRDTPRVGRTHNSTRVSR